MTLEHCAGKGGARMGAMETGIDIVEIDRIQSAIDRHGRRFLDRVFTPLEQSQCGGRAESLAARFAAKEAAFKALGRRAGWTDVEIERQAGGKPRLLLHGEARSLSERLGAGSWTVSLSHSRVHAVAVVIATLRGDAS